MEKLSNFVLTRKKGVNALDTEYFAEVDVEKTTGLLWWKKAKVTRREIRREYAGLWHFTDTGEFTPLSEVGKLERAWKAKHGMNPING